MVRNKKMLARALGVESAVCGRVEEFVEEGGFRVRIRLRKRDKHFCVVCQAECSVYDQSDAVRRWRTHPLGLGKTYVEAVVPRVNCPEHGVRIAYVPWARPGARFTASFEDTIAWTTLRTDKTSVCAMYGITWETVGRILERVGDARHDELPTLDDVTRIGIDEVSYRKGHRYLTIVVDHDTGRLLWAHPGRDKKTLSKFFKMLGKRRCKNIRLVSADAAPWIAAAVAEYCPNAKRCMDPFHVVMWATEAVDKVRRSLWNKLRKRGEDERAASIKGTRWALVKNPENLNGKQRSALAQLREDNRDLFSAYLLKEQLRDVFKNKDWEGLFMLDWWIDTAKKSRLAPFKRLAASVDKHREAIQAALIHGLSNGRLEGVNTKLKLLTRIAYGFHSHKPLVALAMMKLGGLCPPLPTMTWESTHD